MPLPQFPILPGLGWSVTKTPKWQTRIQRAVSGRELRALDQPVPIWTWQLTYDFLRDTPPAYDELRVLMGFHAQQQGAYRPFWYQDPTDSAVMGEGIANGDGVQTVFQLGRSLYPSTFFEPITAIHTLTAIYFDDIVQPGVNYRVDVDTGLLSFTAAPPSGVLVKADFVYFFRVRFADDSADFENFMFQLWSLKQLKFQSALL